eukprot:m.686436 g.686436  ORF g.686436 m.686436 type:complete len:139 (-) comp58626_c0_seq54:1243-1659(-)
MSIFRRKSSLDLATDTLFAAVESKDLPQCAKLVAKSSTSITAKSSKSYTGWTPLHQAAFLGHFDILKLFVSHKPDVNIRDNAGVTPLMLAVVQGFHTCAKLLIDNGANVDLVDDSGQSARSHIATMPVGRSQHISRQL